MFIHLPWECESTIPSVKLEFEFKRKRLLLLLLSNFRAALLDILGAFNPPEKSQQKRKTFSSYYSL